MTEFDELANETEIVFTASSDFDEHFSSIPKTVSPAMDHSDQTTSNEVNTNHTPRQNSEQDAAAKQQVDRLKAKLESSQSVRSTEEAQTKQARFRHLINETRGLNKESEKLNTQSAVLLSALTNLRSEFEESEAHKTKTVGELSQLSTDAASLLHDLKLCKADADESGAQSKALQQSSQALISELQQLTKDTSSQHKTATSLLQDLEKDLEAIAAQRLESENKTKNIIELETNAQAILLELSTTSREAIAKSGQLDQALKEHESSKSSTISLIESLEGIKQDLGREQDIQQQLNEQSSSQIQHSEKLNEQQMTLIELTQSRHEELKNELESVLETSKKYQTRLQQTENKLKDAAQLQEQYKDQYNEAVTKLESNEQLMKNAAKALAETNSQNGKFNSAISKFHHATEQSQQLVIRTQTTLESILSRNQLLERENKVLAEKINALSTSQASLKANPVASTTSAFGSIGDFNFPDPQAGPQAIENKNGFFKLMVVLAILIPMSFIAHSVLGSVGPQQTADIKETLPTSTELTAASSR